MVVETNFPKKHTEPLRVECLEDFTVFVRKDFDFLVDLDLNNRHQSYQFGLAYTNLDF